LIEIQVSVVKLLYNSSLPAWWRWGSWLCNWERTL